jgi:hypothetical protein
MENNRLKINKYSFSILIAFICATIAMLYGTANNSLQDFFPTLPLIVISIYYCQKLAPLLDQPEHNLKKSKLFIRDSFILTFGFLLASLISLIFAYKNSDAKAWWSLIIYLYTLYGFFFSVVFSITALLIKNHKIYTMVFSLLIIIFVSLGKFFPHYIPLPLMGSVDTFFVITGSLLIIHCLFVISYKIVR